MFQISPYILMPFSQLHWQTVRLFFKCSLYHFALPNSSNYFREFLMLQYVCVCLYKFFCVGACMSLCTQMCTLMEARGQHSYFFFFFFGDRIFHWTWSSLIGYTLLISKKIQGSFCVCLPSTGLQVHGSVLGLFSDSWTELKTSCCMRITLQTESSSQSFIPLTFRFVWTFEHLFIKFLGFLRL